MASLVFRFFKFLFFFFSLDFMGLFFFRQQTGSILGVYVRTPPARESRGRTYIQRRMQYLDTNTRAYSLYTRLYCFLLRLHARCTYFVSPTPGRTIL